MPRGNKFKHHPYSSDPPVAPYELLQPEPRPAIGSDEHRERMGKVGEVLRGRNVATIYLINGTFAGDDPFLFHHTLGGYFPKAAAKLSRAVKRGIDARLRDVGNFPPAYVDALRAGLNDGADETIDVERFIWSSADNHIARAAAAVCLIYRLMSAERPGGARVQLWAHSHGGNVLALASNLLAADTESVERFFHAATGYHRRPPLVWRRVKDRLLAGPPLLEQVQLDMVTLGMPVRYGWERDGFSRLLHIVNHHPSPRVAEYRAALPVRLGSIFRGTDGDYVQHAAVCGTNVTPTPILWRAWRAERRMRSLLAPGLSAYLLHRRILAGVRVPHEGRALLVALKPAPSRWFRQLFGHGIYTHYDQMLLQAELIAKWLYA